MNLSRTDLAVETAEALPTGRDMFAPGTGVTKSECLLCGCPVTRIHVHTPAGARAIGKPEGRYITIDLRPALSRQEALTGRAALCLCRELRALLPPPSDGPALVVGLGNDAMTPDAVGAAALELIRGAADRLHPSVVIAIDALAARSRHRLCATVQLGDTGLIPGSGVGNHRKAVNARTLGVPVIALGVPTVIDGAALCGDEDAPPSGLFVTPQDIDRRVRELGRLIGYGVTLALQPGLTPEDAAALLG